MEEDGGDLTPFWVQSTTKLRRSDRLRRSVAAVFFSSGLVVFLLVVAAVFFLAFVVASTISFSATIFRPNSVKKSWDSLNIALVLVAVVFGILSRNRNEERSSSFDEFQSSPIKGNESQKSNSSMPQKWFDYSANDEEKSSLYEYQIQDSHQPKFDQKISNLRRSCSSYPDLREFPSSSSTNWSYGDYQMRNFDDFHVDPSPPVQLRRHRSLGQFDYPTSPPQIKTVVVDTLVTKTCPEIKNFPAELSPAEESQPPEFQESQKRSRERAARRKERSSRRQVYENVGPTNPIATPPPPPPQMMIGERERRRGGATAANSTKFFLNSLYRKKKKKQKSVDNEESLLREAPPPLSSYRIPPPPPPPPSVFHTLKSSKNSKGKKTVTVALEPLPRSPPPVSPPHAAAREAEPTPHAPPTSAYGAPKPVKISTFDGAEEAQNSGGESPFRRIPPPPPPPPFSKTPAWMFVVQGDYVRVNSSRSGSPELDETDSDVTPSAVDGGGPAAALFCPSPDVNSKAESFITKFRANLKLEKIHSMKKRDVGPSSLGPGQGPNQI
ncbi:formin-like protein 6 [Salvia hispanica]|uniref:formin-like protein 6 n=1 Tax=Salvia hispanica TaxID=49212 RepID=UPI002009BEC2|nr:formin-like protein 6 [Salvia hispanica]